MVRRSSSVQKPRIEHLYRDPHIAEAPFYLEYGDLADASSLRRILSVVKPDEIYNLAAQSHVRVSFDQAEYTFDVTASGVLRLLEAIRDYQATTNKQVRYLPGVFFRDVRLVTAAPERGDAFPAPQPLCRCQGGVLLAYSQLSRGLRSALQQRHSFQS